MAFYDRHDRDFGGGGGGGGMGNSMEGGLRPRGKRLITDYGSSMVQWMSSRGPHYKGPPKVEMERPSASYIVDMLPPPARLDNPAEAIPARHLHSSLNKQKFPINVVRWTPEGRRLLTGSSSGEFTLWNGMSFNFETIQQAHASSAIRAAEWSHSGDWLISADQDGNVRYWQPNFNNVFTIDKAHDDPIRDLAFAPRDNKFVTASDDATLKIFDFVTGAHESTITGHNWDAKTVDWHPTKGLLVSGSKDHQVKLWDPRDGRCLTTLHGHKNTISKVAFEKVRGLVLATCARDTTPRIFDLRMMRDICLLRGHEKDISTLVWHPIHNSFLTTGDHNGAMNHYLLNEPNNPPGTEPTIPVYEAKDPTTAAAQIIYPAHRVPHAHEFPIWSMDWHPLGHILATGSNDKVTRFWSRARPGEIDCFNDRYHLGEAAAEAHGTWNRNVGRRQQREEEDQEAEDEAEGLRDQASPSAHQTAPGLGLGGLINLPSGFPALPGMGAVPPPPVANGGFSLPGLNPTQPPPPPTLQGINSERLQMMLGQHQNALNSNQPSLPFPPPGQNPLSLPFQLPPPTPGGTIPPPPNWQPPDLRNWDFSKGPPPPPPGWNVPQGGNAPPPPVPPGMGIPGLPVADPRGMITDPRMADSASLASVAASIRKRGPLPSQSESLKEEMRRGNYRQAR